MKVIGVIGAGQMGAASASTTPWGRLNSPILLGSTPVSIL
jgi:3-hydroxyacyl-CoA dehydrogenase